MRILRFLLFSFFGLAFLALLSFFFGREILLVLGSSMIKADYDTLLKKNYAEDCVRQFSYNQEYWTQLRFTSNKEYNLEVVCADFVNSPIILSSKKLPPLLFKQSTGSGFVIDERQLPYVVELSALYRKIFIYTEEQNIRSNYLFKADLDYELGPVSSCQSHNRQCCGLDVQSGIGEQMTQVNDCPKSCYESCLLRPVVLSFNTRPAIDDETRIVELARGEAITFSYVLGDGKGDVFANQLNKEGAEPFLDKLQTIFSGQQSALTRQQLVLPLTITVDLGDGEIWQSNNLQDTFDHTYSCANNICFYQVKLSAQDGQGVLSVENELAKMVIKVNR